MKLIGHLALARILVFLISLVALPAMAQEGPKLTDIIEAWLASPHAERSDEAFVHWDEDGAIPESCATCHSGAGLRDFLGADGSTVGKVDQPAMLGTTVDCATCHNKTASTLETVTFPSGAVASGLGSSAICAVCHQGRQSTESVNSAIAGGEDDTVNGDLGFLNVHYRAAAATLMGDAARGGYQYEGRTYVGQFTHAPTVNTCASCHNPHTTEVVVETCATCHKDIDDPKAVRFLPIDYDADGDITEGVHGEVTTLHAALGAAINAYSTEVIGSGVVYDSNAYPYFFADSDGNGAVTEGEAIYPNRYQSWTPRLLKAAYNYQFVAKDPGGYTHNPKYVLQLLYDSLDSIAAVTSVDTAALVRP